MIRHQVVGLTYTRTCPLACRHCISDSSPVAKGRMTPAQVRRYLPAIRRFAPHVAFTGGEPLLYHREIVDLAADAKHLGLEVSVVTGAGWAKAEAPVRARVTELAAAGVTRLVVSWDAYHEEHAPRDNALRVARAACEAGMTVELRTVIPAHRALDEYHAPFRDLPLRLESTRPVRLGTARSLPDDHFELSHGPPKGICNVVLRPVVEPDGSVYACCGPGHFARRRSPLFLGNAEETPLEEILARGVGDPILETISLLGPHGLSRLLQDHETGRDGFRPGARYTSVCELCLDINDSPDLVAALRGRLAGSDAQILLAAARMWTEKKMRPAGCANDPASTIEAR